MYLLTFVLLWLFLKRYASIRHISTVFLLKHPWKEMHKQAPELHKMMILWMVSQVIASIIWVIRETSEAQILLTQMGWTHGVSIPGHFFLHPPETLLRKHSSKPQLQTEKWLKARTLIKSLISPLLPLRPTHQPVSPSQPFPSSVSTRAPSCAQQHLGSLSTQLTKLHTSYFLAACCADTNAAEHPFSELMHKSPLTHRFFRERLGGKNTTNYEPRQLLYWLQQRNTSYSHFFSLINWLLFSYWPN